MSSPIPGFFDLLKESWNILRAKFKPLILLSLAEVAIIFAIIGLFSAITAISSLSSITKLSITTITAASIIPLLTDSLPQIITFGLILLLLVSVVSAIFAAAKIYALTVDLPFGKLVAFGKSKIYRIFTSQLVIALLSFGGFWLFGIPGLLFAYLTSFAIYEVVLTNASVSQSLKNSVAIIWHNFWALLGRYLLIFILMAIIRSLFSSSGNNSQAISSLSWIIDTITGWFVLAYSYLLYKYSKANTPEGSKINLAWLIVPAVVGWIAFYTLFYFGAKFLQSRGVFDDFGTKIEQMIQDNKGLDLQQELKNLETTT